MIKQVYFFGEEMAKKAVVRKDTAMISISENSDVDLPDWGNRILRLRFHDIDQRHIDAHPDLVTEYTIFNVDHAKQIVYFLHNLDDRVNTIYVHCAAGISRSAGVAFFIGEKYNVRVNKMEIKFWFATYRLYNKLVYSTLKKVDNANVGQLVESTGLNPVK